MAVEMVSGDPLLGLQWIASMQIVIGPKVSPEYRSDTGTWPGALESLISLQDMFRGNRLDT